MKLSKFLSIASLTTLVCLIYVWQQTEVFRLAYDEQKRQAKFQDLLDENSLLRYNLKKKTSLVHIGNAVSGTGEFQMPENYCLVRLVKPQKSLNFAGSRSHKRESLFAKIFGRIRQAEAKTLTPSYRFSSDGKRTFVD